MRVQHGHRRGLIPLWVESLVALGTLVVFLSPAWAAADTKPAVAAPLIPSRATVVQGVNVHEDSGKLVIDLQTQGTPTFKSFELENPHRIVVEVMNAELGAKQRLFTVDRANIKSIRLSQVSGASAKTVRVIFATTGKTPYTLKGEENAVRMVLPQPEKSVEKISPPNSTSNVVGAQNRPATIVRGMESHKEGDDFIVFIRADGVLRYKTFDLDHPNRLVVDLSEVILRSANRSINVKEGDVVAVRMSQFSSGKSPTVRVVLEGSRKLNYKAESSSEGLTLVLPSSKVSLSQVGKVSSNLEPKPAKPAPEPQWASLKAPDLTVLDNPVQTQPASPPTDWMSLPEKLQAPNRAVVNLENIAQIHRPDPSVELVRYESIRPPEPTGASAKNTDASKNVTPPVREKTEIAPQAVAELQAAPAPSQTSTAGPPAPAQINTIINQPPPTVNPSDIISLDLRDVDIRDFFRLIHEVSGLNIILDPSVRGNLTIALKDVPWEQALDIVLRNNQLGKQLEGNVLRIVTLKALEEEQVARRKILESQQAEEAAAAKRTYTRTPSYLKAKDIANVFVELLGIKGGRGNDDVIFDDAANMVIVRTSPKKMEELDAIMKAMDVKSQQVEIEARVVAANRSFLRDLGVQLGAQFFSDSGRNIISGVPSLNSPVVRSPRPPVSSAAPSASPGSGTTGPLPLNLDLGAKAATSGFGYLFTGGNALIDAFITAAEAKGTAKLLSKPKIITQNHIEGLVSQGIRIPVQTVVNNTVSVQFIEFALKLTVTPQITEEGTVILDANVLNDTPDFQRQVQGIPTVQSQQAKTRVLISDGGTVVIGGVLIDQNFINYRQVPGLGDVPVIGSLFKNKSVQTNTQELLFFLTPKILK